MKSTEGAACKCCSALSVAFASGMILKSHRIRYFRCPACGFIQTEEPYWLSEAYSDAISSTDVGLVDRNVRLALLVRFIILVFFKHGSLFVDYGGGYGLLVRLLRDHGFNFQRMDPMCRNLFAQHHDATPNTKADLLTAFEVFEHLVNPVEELSKMLKYSRNILFSTLLVPKPVPPPGDWWYYCLETGQHVSFYTEESLRHLGAQFGLKLLTDHKSLHMLTDQPSSQFVFQATARHRLAALVSPFTKRRSLLPADAALGRTIAFIK